MTVTFQASPLNTQHTPMPAVRFGMAEDLPPSRRVTSTTARGQLNIMGRQTAIQIQEMMDNTTEATMAEQEALGVAMEMVGWGNVMRDQLSTYYNQASHPARAFDGLNFIEPSLVQAEGVDQFLLRHQPRR